MNIKKSIVIGATAITSLVAYEIALIGTRAVAEDAEFISACTRVKLNKPNKKNKKKGRKRR